MLRGWRSRDWAKPSRFSPGRVQSRATRSHGSYRASVSKREGSPGRKRPPESSPRGVRLSSDDVHDIVYFRRHVADDPTTPTPGQAFLAACPEKVRATMRAVLIAVAAAPPKRFAGGGYWEAMHGGMTGWFEVRVDGPPRRTHYRLFCLLDYEASSGGNPLLVIVDGRAKAFRTTLSSRDYEAVRRLGNEYRARQPRSVA